MTQHRHFHHHYRSPVKRSVFSLVIVVGTMLFGIAGMHYLEKLSWLDAFYFMSMIATSQGPMMMPVTPAGKIFASFMAFLSVGIVAAALGFLFGPFFGQLWRIGVEHLEEDLNLKNKDKTSRG